MKIKAFAAMLIAAAITATACGEVKETALPDAAEAAASEADEADEAAASETPDDNEPKAAADDKDTPVKEDEVTDKDTPSTYPDERYAEETDKALASTDYTRTRAADKGSGDIVDTSVYKDADGNIVKVVTDDYGSDGLISTEYYYDGDTAVYIKQSKTDVYGTGSSYTDVDLSDPEADYTADLIKRAGEVLNTAKKDSGKVLLYGYVGDEQGGIVKNATVKLRNVSGDFNAEEITNGDGYYTFELPQQDDTYNLTYIYGDNLVSSLNDVHIIPGTPEYSLGRVYVAPAGAGIHDTDTYLLNPNVKAPVDLKEGEYAAVITAEAPDITIKLISKDDNNSKTGNVIVFDPSDSKSGYVLFVEDGTNIGKDDMSGNMGKSSAIVTILDKDGIKAAYLAPVGRLGTLWRVCDIDSSGDMAVSGILYTDTKGWK